MKEKTKVFSARQVGVMNAALDIIAERGIKGLTMKNIGRRLNMTDAAIYRHFRGKRDILHAITGLFEESSCRILDKIVHSDKPGLAKIRDFFLDRCAEFAGNRGLATVMFSDDLFKNDRTIMGKFHAIMNQHKQMLLHSIRQSKVKGELRCGLPAEHVFIVVMGSLRLLITKWRGEGFAFDMVKAGKALWHSLETLLKGEK